MDANEARDLRDKYINNLGERKEVELSYIEEEMRKRASEGASMTIVGWEKNCYLGDETLQILEERGFNVRLRGGKLFVDWKDKNKS